ncbi:MAG: hypothetical protein Q9164_002658 [Protoblastenia rupestris]
MSLLTSLKWFLGFLYSQFFITPPKPTTSFAGQIVIITGSNTGLGLDAARQITSLHAAKVILAVRTISKGEAAQRSIEQSTGRKGVVEVWPLDLSNYESVQQFAARARKNLERVDVLLENAGMMTTKFIMTEEDESTVTTNVVSTFLLALLMLPKLRETAKKFNTKPRLTVVTSDLHFVATFPERKADNIFDALNDKTSTNFSERYGTTKLMQILLARHIHSSINQAASSPEIIINSLTPGACASDFFREEVESPVTRFILETFKTFITRTTEVGARTLVAAASAGDESAGKYMADGVLSYESPFVNSAEGRRTEEKLWEQLAAKLEKISPGIGRNVYG